LFWRGKSIFGRDAASRQGHAWVALASLAGAVFLSLIATDGPARAENREIKFYNIHTQEKLDVVFKRDGIYDQAALTEINLFLRDWRKDEVIKMDPHLLDLVWQVYQQSGSQDYIHVVCGYRTPSTNAMLRSRSKLVARNSLHMQGKALDFFIPDVSLAKLRVIGLRMQRGGVGFYPTSGSPFVHMDTGHVRYWPRMSREQLARIFPDGKTLDIPSDGKPLPGYDEALAAYQARKNAAAPITVAKFGPVPSITTGSGKPVTLASYNPPVPAVAPARLMAEQVASADAGDEVDQVDDASASTLTPVTRRTVAVASASYSTTPTPLPRLAPRPRQPIVTAAAEPVAPAPSHSLKLDTATTASLSPVPGIDFGSPQIWSPPAVPAALAAAMAARDHARPAASVPIAPTAVVATIDVSRPLRAAAITTAVLRTRENADSVPEVLAYAPVDSFAPNPPLPTKLNSAAAMSLPSPSPQDPAAVPQPTTTSFVRTPHMQAPPLTMTNLDTEGLRLWIGPGSTRQKNYALLTMPDFSQSPSLISKPQVTFAAGFGNSPYVGLRTDHFSGPLVVQPLLIDLTGGTLVTAQR